MLGQIFDMTLYESKHARFGYSVLAELFFNGFICKISKNFAFHRNECKQYILYDWPV